MELTVYASALEFSSENNLQAYMKDSFGITCRLAQTTSRTSNQEVNGKTLPSFADDYRKLAIDCLKVLRVEMQLETIFHMQV